MKIHDALVLELIKPDESGKPTGDIIKIVGTANIKYTLEAVMRSAESFYPANVSWGKFLFEGKEGITILEEMAPDILIRKVDPPSEDKDSIVVEVETDVDFDFGSSLRQIKKYKKEFGDQVIVIIPREYERFAPLYKNEGFRVWLWEAERVWQCLICGDETVQKGPVRPKCKKCNKATEHRLIGLRNSKFEEFSGV